MQLFTLVVGLSLATALCPVQAVNAEARRAMTPPQLQHSAKASSANDTTLVRYSRLTTLNCAALMACQPLSSRVLFDGGGPIGSSVDCAKPLTPLI
jgi:hypothetical protein